VLKTIYIARDFELANRLKLALKEKGITAVLNRLQDQKEEGLGGNVEISVLKSEAQEAFYFINEALIEETI